MVWAAINRMLSLTGAEEYRGKSPFYEAHHFIRQRPLVELSSLPLAEEVQSAYLELGSNLRGYGNHILWHYMGSGDFVEAVSPGVVFRN